MADEASHKANELKDTAQHKYEQGKAMGAQMADQASQKAGEMKETAQYKVNETVEQTKQTGRCLVKMYSH